MHFRCNRTDNHTLEYDLSQSIKLRDRTCQHMGPRIYFEYMLCFVDIQYSKHIPDGIQTTMDYPRNLIHKSKHLHCTRHFVRMGLVGICLLLQLVGLLKWFNVDFFLCQWIFDWTQESMRFKKMFRDCLRAITIGWHRTKAFPSKPGLQAQLGTWFKTLQTAFKPQEPGQGSIQRSFTHALVFGQSELIVHSGRQKGGEP